MKNPNRLLKKLRTYTNKNIRDILNNQQETIIPPIPKKYLPAECYLRDLYNQAYFCHYSNLGDASLSLSCVCLERISRDLYIKFIGDDEGKEWNQILEQLNNFFKSYTQDDLFKKAVLEFISNSLIIKDDIRNLLLHGKIENFIKDTLFKHNAINAFTGKNEEITLEYNELIHGKDRGKIKLEKINLASHKILVFISMSVIRFNKYLNLKEI